MCENGFVMLSVVGASAIAMALFETSCPPTLPSPIIPSAQQVLQTRIWHILSAQYGRKRKKETGKEAV